LTRPRKKTPPPARPSARDLALRLLGRVEEEDAFAEILLDRTLEREDLSPPDRRLLYELTLGVLRWQARLDHFLGQVTDRPVAKLDRTTRRVLRLGAYQLLMLEKIPAAAAVNEAVKLAPLHARPYVNAVLRSLSRQKDRLTLPDPETDPTERIAVTESHPAWMVARWVRELGAAEAEALCRANNSRPGLTLRVNTLRAAREELLEKFREAGIAAEATSLSPLGIKVLQHAAPRNLPGWAEGLFAVQDEASQLVGMLLAAAPGERVLDACAAPGTKSLQIAQALAGQGEVKATDRNARRLGLLAKEARRLGLDPILVEPADWTGAKELGPFDRILVDAPCSALGTLRRHPELKWRRRPEDFAALAELQKKILVNVSRCLRPGGLLVYATCTYGQEENEEVVKELLESEEFALADAAELLPASARAAASRKILRTWPHRHGTDGFTAHVLCQ
jgi:16S rRNA (cytosine967-C5)-methyltransferase